MINYTQESKIHGLEQIVKSTVHPSTKVKNIQYRQLYKATTRQVVKQYLYIY